MLWGGGHPRCRFSFILFGKSFAAAAPPYYTITSNSRPRRLVLVPPRLRRWPAVRQSGILNRFVGRFDIPDACEYTSVCNMPFGGEGVGRRAWVVRREELYIYTRSSRVRVRGMSVGRTAVSGTERTFPLLGKPRPTLNALAGRSSWTIYLNACPTAFGAACAMPVASSP